jgi:hypothetical protein
MDGRTILTDGESIRDQIEAFFSLRDQSETKKVFRDLKTN